MPKKGYATITVRIDVHEKIGKYAEKTNRTIPGAIEHLVENAEKSLKRAEKKTVTASQQAS